MDAIQQGIGSFGRYQLMLCVTLFLCKIPIAFHQISIVFIAPRITYTCPPSDNATCPCLYPKYDRSVFEETMTTKWHLICEKKWLNSFNQMVFMLGSLFGSILYGMAADRFGRRKPFLMAVTFEVSIGIAESFVQDYWFFTFLRFIVGLSVGGTMVISFVILMEFIGAKNRELISALYQMPFTIGHLMIPIFAYFLRNFYNFLLGTSVPTLILLCYFYFVPETPRWLIAMKKTDEAINILKRAAEMNRLPTENIRRDVEAYQAAVEQNRLKKGNIIDLFRTPNLRKNIIVMSFNWLTCSYCFYGVSQYVGHLSGNIFVNVAASAFFNLVGVFITIPLLKYLGRRTLLIVFNILCFVCLILLAVIPEGYASVVFACIGAIASFIVFIVVYLYCSELFPTVVRNAAVGFSSMMARVGSMIAPFVVDLRDEGVWLPPFLFAVVPLVAGCLSFLLPETKGCELTTTIEEGERFGKKDSKKPTENI